MFGEIIKVYQGKLGVVTIERYGGDGIQEEFRVAHSAIVGPTWFDNKRDAIVHAQFLAGRY